MLNCSGMTLGARAKFYEGVMEAAVSVDFSSAVTEGRNIYSKPSAPMNSSSPFMGVRQAMSLLKELGFEACPLGYKHFVPTGLRCSYTQAAS